MHLYGLGNRVNASDADLAHLFKTKTRAPLYLSHILNIPRRLTADEVAQLSEQGYRATTRESWELRPTSINGVPHADLCHMTAVGDFRHAEATWHLELAPGYSQLRLTRPLGSGRALSKEECRQLRSIGGEFAKANTAWSAVPSPNTLAVQIVRDTRNVMTVVGTVALAFHHAAPVIRRAKLPISSLRRESLAVVASMF
jgi:hypothetical protein